MPTVCVSCSLPLWLLSPVHFHLFFTNWAFCSCNIREEGALHASGERVHRLCVTILNNTESLPSLSLECPVLIQNDSPLSVGSLHREGQCGEIPKMSFPEASTNKISLERLSRDIVHVLWCAPVRALSPSAPRLGRSDAQSQDHGGCCSSDLLDHHPQQAVCFLSSISHICV